jgi:hypothetical protein
MKRPSTAAALFAIMVALAASAASAAPILFTYTGLRGGASDTCKWFDDNITDRSVDALTRQTDMLYNRIALPAGEDVTVGGTAVTLEGEQVVDFHVRSALICSAGEPIYGPTPMPSDSTPMPAPS